MENSIFCEVFSENIGKPVAWKSKNVIVTFQSILKTIIQVNFLQKLWVTTTWKVSINKHGRYDEEEVQSAVPRAWYCFWYNFRFYTYPNKINSNRQFLPANSHINKYSNSVE